MPLAPAARARLQASLACLGTFAVWWISRHTAALFVFAAAAPLALLAWLAPSRYAPIQRALDRFAHLLLAALTWSVLGLVYFGLFTPLRLWRTLTGRDPLALQRPPTNGSYLQPFPAASPRFDRQF